MKKEKRKELILIIVLIIVAVFAVSLLFVSISKLTSKKEEIVEKIKEEVKEEIVVDEWLEYKDLWNDNYAINTDYVGEVIFDSSLINSPFVCPRNDLSSYIIYDNYAHVVEDLDNGCEEGRCSLNDAYLRVDWKTKKYNLGGSVFMDYRNTTNDQNIIIYGHHYPKSYKDNQNDFFTPLGKLLQKENYEGNDTVKLVLNGEVRHYKIVYVYLFNPSSDDYDNLQYFRTNYDLDYWGEDDNGYYLKYIENMEKAKLYDTGEKLTDKDNTLTLQTCVENSLSVEIVVAKQIEK